MDRFERFMVRTYARRALGADRSSLVKRPSRALAVWLYEHAGLIGVDEPEEVAQDGLDLDAVVRIDRTSWAAFAPVVRQLLTRMKAPPASALEKRLDWLCETLTLSAPDAEILKVCVRAGHVSAVRQLAEAFEMGVTGRDEVNRAAIAALSGLPLGQVRRHLAPAQPLRLLGLVEDRAGGDYAPSLTVQRIARLETTNPERLRAALIGKRSKPELAWSDFAHLGPPRDVAERLLGAAIEKREPGINILLHGSPGTGKTEFVRTLGARLGAAVVFVGETGDEDEEPSRASRIAAFALLRALAGRAGGTLLVVDEADDVFTGVDEDDAQSRVGSKVFMNRLVERTDAPTIWITNHPERLGPAVLRRMALAIRFPEPGRQVRRRIVERAAAHRKLKLAPAAIEGLAALTTSPAVIDTALRVAKLAGGDPLLTATCSACSLMEAMEEARPPAPPLSPIDFDPLLSTADQDLARLADRVTGAGGLALSFCLHGLPGTGKSAFARYLAGRLGLDVVEKRGSDLLSMWVGETEKGIARAFQQAADTRSFLIFDEADSLLRDRAGARNTWEVTQVNEMLTWMERHPFPFACTTNLAQSLDPATLRRFTFKVRFLPMTLSQARDAFVRTFGLVPPSALDSIAPLAPGDFVVTARRARILGERDPGLLVKMLADEVAAKPGATRGPLGFTSRRLHGP